MRFTVAVAAVLVAAVPSPSPAQANDSLNVGQRIRVQIAASPGNTSVFIGNLAALASDTLVVSIPGGKGRVVVPRASISSVSVSAGHASRFTNLPGVVLIAAAPAFLMTAPLPTGPHHNALRNQRIALIGIEGAMLWRFLARAPSVEHWRPVTSWLDR